MNNETINVGFVVDEGYVKYLSVTMISILMNTNGNVAFHIINDGSITQESMDKINNLKQIKDFSIKYYSSTNILHHEKRSDTRQDITAVTNNRLLLAEILVDVEKIIFLDADLIAVKSLSELYHIQIDDYYIACCPALLFSYKYTRQIDIPDHVFYCNTGVMLVNLKKWREENITDRLLAVEAKYRGIYKFYDQCILNAALYDKIYYLNQK
jgi:lipopolysaccharide biosynthesis glycosyltransferase